MTELEKVSQWLQTFPEWTGSLTVDYADAVPGNTGLYPKGMTELSRREDVLGNVRVRCQYAFCLRRVAAPDIENAQWLLSLQQWVQQQAIRGLAPVFGDEPHEERIRAFDGKLQQRAQVGSEHYTVMLTVEFTKIFRGE